MFKIHINKYDDCFSHSLWFTQEVNIIPSKGDKIQVEYNKYSVEQIIHDYTKEQSVIKIVVAKVK